MPRVESRRVPVQLQVFDGSGHLFGEWSLGGQGTASLFAGLGALPAGSTIYFGITAGNSSGSGATSARIDYQLWVGSQSATDTATIVAVTGTTGPLSAFLAAGALPPSAATSSAAPPSNGNSQAALAASTAPPNGGGNSRVAVGSPATRSAGPSGGLLSEGDPAPGRPERFPAHGGQQRGMGRADALPATHNPNCRRGRARGVLGARRRIPGGAGGRPTVPAGSPLHWAHEQSDIGDGIRRRWRVISATTSDRADGELRVVASSAPAEPEIPLTEGDIAAQSPIFRGRTWGRSGRSPRSPPAWAWRPSSP